MSTRSQIGRCGQTEDKPGGNLRSCGCARRYLPSPPLVPSSINGPGRSRSSTGSSAGGAKSRSRTPSNLSSGRTTPSPTRGNGMRFGMGDRAMSESALLNLQDPPPRMEHPRFVSTFHLKPKCLSAHYTTTVLIRIGSTRRHHIQEIKYEMRLTPNKSTTDTPEDNKPSTTEKRKIRHFKTEFEVELQQPDTTVIKIHRPQSEQKIVDRINNQNDTNADNTRDVV